MKLCHEEDFENIYPCVTYFINAILSYLRIPNISHVKAHHSYHASHYEFIEIVPKTYFARSQSVADGKQE